MPGCILRFLLDLPPSLSCFELHQLKTMTSGEIKCKKKCRVGNSLGVNSLFKGGLRDRV